MKSAKLFIQFVDPEDYHVGPQLQIPLSIKRDALENVLNQLLENDEPRPFTFSLTEYGFAQVTSNLEALVEALKISAERVLKVTYHPLAVFSVRPVTRCSVSLPGHSEAVLCVAFSPDGKHLASGSGDTTVRLWDLNTKTPSSTCVGHSNWVLCVCWEPLGRVLATAGMDKTIRLWNPGDGLEFSQPLYGHTQAVTSLSWQPMHLVDVQSEDAACPNKLASGSRDGSIRVWDVVLSECLIAFGGHTNMVTQIQWSGETGPESSCGFIYSCSRDTMVKVWDPTTGKLVRDLKGHAHWVNCLCINTENCLRTGPFEIQNDDKSIPSISQAKAKSLEVYKKTVKDMGGERVLTGSDDFTMFLWTPSKARKPIARMTGHQKIVNHVCFSPDGRLIASASFDKSIRLWNGHTGAYLMTLRGHVGSVYRLSWTADSRLLLSVSADSTVKLWDVAKGKLKEDLPGHADEVYAVDWSPDGRCVATGSKDKVLKIWEN